MVGKTVEAQQITLYILLQYELAECHVLYENAKKRLEGNLPAQQQLNICLLMADELRENPKRYDDFRILVKTIIARKSGLSVSKVKMVNFLQEIGFFNPNDGNIYRAIEDFSRPIGADEVEMLCDGFQRNANRLFWKNQIYAFFPYMRMENTIGGPELHCLRAVWDCVEEAKKVEIAEVLPQYYTWFYRILIPEEGNELYAAIDQARAKHRISLDDIYEKVEKDKKTWKSYATQWATYQLTGGINGFPRNCLQLEDLLHLAILLNMDYGETVHLVELAGYSFHLKFNHDKIMDYFLYESKRQQKILEQGHENLSEKREATEKKRLALRKLHVTNIE